MNEYVAVGKIIYEKMGINPIKLIDTTMLQIGQYMLNVCELEDFLLSKGLLEDDESVFDSVLRNYGRTVVEAVTKLV